MSSLENNLYENQENINQEFDKSENNGENKNRNASYERNSILYSYRNNWRIDWILCTYYN